MNASGRAWVLTERSTADPALLQVEQVEALTASGQKGTETPFEIIGEAGT